MIAAIVPAAGQSLRMGRPKLTLPVGGVPLIARVIAALLGGGAGRVIVIVGPTDMPGNLELIEAAEGQGAEVLVSPTPTADMRASIELGLERISQGTEPEAVLLTPGDSPGLDAAIVARVIGRASDHPGLIIVPRHQGRRGHPLLLPWSLAIEIPRLPAGVGVNALLAAHPEAINAFDADDPGILADIDTPEDYRRWSGG
jgi:molybdenum cofactor cytidylyltransferase